MKSFLIALSMYSKIPVPHIEWDNKNMKYVFLFFPFIGLIIGGCIFLWFSFAVYKGFNGLFFAAIATAIPVFITGGIHVDGFMDTVDALSSYGDTEKRQKILKDPHVGAFGVIMCFLYLLVQTAIWLQIYENPIFLKFALIIFIISRTITALSIFSLPLARNTGLAHIFSSNSDKFPVKAGLTCYILILFAITALIDITLGFLTIITIFIVLWLYKSMARKSFGGISGDLCGYLLQWIEILLLLLATIC